MGLILPFRGYVPHKGVQQHGKKTAWNQKAITQIERFKSVLDNLNAMHMGASYGSGKAISHNDAWFEEIYFEEDLEQRTVLHNLSEMSERGSIVVVSLTDIFQETLKDHLYGYSVSISPIDKIRARFIPVISIGHGASSLTNNISTLIRNGAENNIEKIQNAIINNYNNNAKTIENRITQLKRLSKNNNRREERILYRN